MTTKFKPFDPTTAQNGDTVYLAINTKKAFRYIGPDIVNKDASVIHNDQGYGWDFNSQLVVAVPKRTVWINMYSGSVECKTAYWYDEEDQARAGALPKSKYYIGTYSLEIDAE